MFGRFSKAVVRIASILLVLAAVPARGQEAIVGTWELVGVTPRAIEDSDPRGVTNTKWHFTGDGKVFVIAPDQPLSEKADVGRYTYEGAQLTLVSSDGQKRLQMVTMPDANSMVWNGRTTFRRMNFHDAEKMQLEPKSLQLVNLGGVASPPADVSYDGTDYSAVPLQERVKGAWEVLAHHDVPRNALPPYGFFNDLWIIGQDSLMIVFRGPREERVTISYLFKDGSIVPEPRDRGPVLKVTFNRWGHLVLDSGQGAMVLKLLTKSTKGIPPVPLKIGLVRSSAK